MNKVLLNILKTDNSLLYKFFDLNSGQVLSDEKEIDNYNNSINSLFGNSKIIEQELFEHAAIKFDIPQKQIMSSLEWLERLNKKRTKGYIAIELNEVEHFNLINIFLNVTSSSVKSVFLDYGYNFYNFEQKMTANSFLRNIYDWHKISQVDSTSSVNHYLMAYERQLNIDIPEKAVSFRMMFLEFSRVLNHFFDLYNIVKSINFLDYATLLKTEFVNLHSFLCELVRNEKVTTIFVLGGVRDISASNWISLMLNFVQKLEKRLLIIYRKFQKDAYVKERLDNSRLDKTLLFRNGVTGVIARASGLNFDMRRDSNYYLYNEVDFEVPLGIGGKTIDRFVIRLEECFQSFKIITQLIDNLPSGNLMNPLLSDLYCKDKSNDSFQTILNQIKNVDESQFDEVIEHPRGLSSLGKYHNSVGSNKFYYSSPSSHLLSLFSEAVIDNDLDNILPLWNSLGINMKEVEK